MRVRVIGTIAAGLAVVAIAEPAIAVKWHSVDDPLVAYDNGVAQALAHGNFHNGDGQIAQSESYQKDPRPGGDSIYVETAFFWYGPNQSCGSTGSGDYQVCFWYDTLKQTDRSNTATWEWHWRGRDLRADASQARGTVKTCEDQSWSPDPCSMHVVATFDY